MFILGKPQKCRNILVTLFHYFIKFLLKLFLFGENREIMGFKLIILDVGPQVQLFFFKKVC